MTNKKYLNFLKGDEKGFDEITIKIRDPEHQMIKFLIAARSAANAGHSYTVVLDAETAEYKQEFGFDGDGLFFIKDIKFNGRKLEDKK